MTRGPLPKILVAILAVALGACRERSQEVVAGAASQPADHRRTLALAPSSGSGPADRALATARFRAQQAGATADAWVLLARAWISKARVTGDPGFYLSALAAAQVGLDLSPGFGLALGVKALALLNGHKFREARRLADEILAGDSEDLVALGVLSDALVELGDLAGAAGAAQRMMDLKPSLPSYSRASYLRWLKGDETGAKALIRLAIDSGRGARDREPSAWALVQAALIFWHAGDVDGADAGFDEALKVVPGYAQALVGKARVALARKNTAAAVDMARRAVAAAPSVEALWLLADALELAGDRAGAAEATSRLVQEGRRGDHLGLAGFLAAKNRDPHEALALVEDERQVRGGVMVDDAYAWALFRAGRLAEARAASDQALRHKTPDARLWFHAGAIRMAQGETHEGAALVRKALDRNPHFDASGAAEAVGLLRSDARASAGSFAGSGPR